MNPYDRYVVWCKSQGFEPAAKQTYENTVAWLTTWMPVEDHAINFYMRRGFLYNGTLKDQTKTKGGQK